MVLFAHIKYVFRRLSVVVQHADLHQRAVNILIKQLKNTVCVAGCGWESKEYPGADQGVGVVTTLFLDIINQYGKIFNNRHNKKDLK